MWGRGWGGGALLCRVTRSFRECSGERLSIDPLNAFRWDF